MKSAALQRCTKELVPWNCDITWCFWDCKYTGIYNVHFNSYIPIKPIVDAKVMHLKTFLYRKTILEYNACYFDFDQTCVPRETRACYTTVKFLLIFEFLK